MAVITPLSKFIFIFLDLCCSSVLLLYILYSSLEFYFCPPFQKPYFHFHSHTHFTHVLKLALEYRSVFQCQNQVWNLIFSVLLFCFDIGFCGGKGLFFVFIQNVGFSYYSAGPCHLVLGKVFCHPWFFPARLFCVQNLRDQWDRKSTITTLCQGLRPGCLKSVLKVRLGSESYWRRAVAETCIGYSSEQNDQGWGMVVAGQFYQWKSHFLKWNRMGVKKQSRAYPGKESGYSWECWMGVLTASVLRFPVSRFYAALSALSFVL